MLTKTKHYNLKKQTLYALIPLLVSFLIYPLLPDKIYVPTATTDLSPWGIKSNIFVYPLFGLILWLGILAFIYFNRLRERNLDNIHESYRPLESYYILGEKIIIVLTTAMVFVEFIVTLLN
ncbi:hypothetical protein M5C72_00310 [Companilactobacillus allii]|uniref:DUF1648 domain-containing protein n=1 Tax=Companilactobacillus allii TaxID=1847728 RepID=A0A1P8Q181_9LACO|nr:hypothetical protein [Companilactobacillus allii]APX71632.1 hypothetical protein BTM29_03250 [Companilactobacillus allii]USQ68715.1 hypothetical protein M5C72_00310 [Companilactobacillus allii]